MFEASLPTAQETLKDELFLHLGIPGILVQSLGRGWHSANNLEPMYLPCTDFQAVRH